MNKGDDPRRAKLRVREFSTSWPFVNIKEPIYYGRPHDVFYYCVT